MRQIKKHKLTVALFLSLALGWGSVYGEDLSEEQQLRLDTIEMNLDDMESKVRSTLMFGGSSPISFSGEARVKLQWHNFNVYPDYLHNDRSYLQSGWEGNENMVRVGLVARPGRNTVLWAKLGFQHTMPGNRYIEDDDAFADDQKDGSKLVQTRHDKSNANIRIHEDMNAGIAIRTVPASFWLKMGNVQWTEASPLTIWKAQPRTFAWEYLPFEVEQPIARYYEYNIAKGEKTGRAAWNKKPFNGINFESINLPANLYLNVLYGSFERFDNFEREYLDFSNDAAYAGETNLALKGMGIGDQYRKLFHLRLAAKKFYNDLTIGFNTNIIDYKEDIIYTKGSNGNQFTTAFELQENHTDIYIDSNLTNETYDSLIVSRGRAFYKEPRVVSLDLKGPLNDAFSIHGDFALGWTDTTWLTADTAEMTNVDAIRIKSQEVSTSALKPAFFGTVDWNGQVPMSADVAYISQGFYSPFSFAIPFDAFYAFGTNMLGAGKFSGSEGSPYTQNMAGILLNIEPKLAGYGHLRIKYGQHFQLKAARDLLFFPYRLNGPDMFSVFHSSYTRWANGEVDQYFNKNDRYDARLGDESFVSPQAFNEPDGPASGGLRSDFLAMFEGFVAYQDSASAARNLNSKSTTLNRNSIEKNAVVDGETVDVVEYENAAVPHHQKFTFNLESDFGYDIGPLIGYSNDFFLGGYASINGVSTTFKPLAFGDNSEDMLLWSVYLRFEPAIAITKRFYLIGLLGFENWRSQKAYMADGIGSKKSVVHTPIDFRDYAYGLGMDWDVFERVGLHLRTKWMFHKDMHFEDNNWSTPVISTEMKMWF